MTLRDFYLKRAKAEFPVFLKVLRALPKDLSYKPHDRSPSAEQLVWTVTNELKALIDVVETGKSEWEDSKPPSLDEMIGMFDKWSIYGRRLMTPGCKRVIRFAPEERDVYRTRDGQRISSRSSGAKHELVPGPLPETLRSAGALVIGFRSPS